MFVQPIDYVIAVWPLVSFLCAIWVARDMYCGTPEPIVMKWGIILVTRYMGPLGLLMYVLACKEPHPARMKNLSNRYGNMASAAQFTASWGMQRASLSPPRLPLNSSP